MSVLKYIKNKLVLFVTKIKCDISTVFVRIKPWQNSLVWSVVIILFFTSCDDMHDKLPDGALPQNQEISQIFVLCEGLFNMNNSTLAMYDFDAKNIEKDYFLSANKRGLGDTANDMELYGGKLYVVVNVSSQIEILDIQTGVSVQQISMFNDHGIARQPRYICFDKGKAYVSSFDGTVTRIDTATLQIDKIVQVGKNPEGICVANRKLYVSNSGGLDYPNYDNTVSVIDIETFTEIKKIVVGTNPYKIQADSQGDVYLTSRGNYAQNGYLFQRINSTTDLLEHTFNEINALNFSIHNDTAYIYNYDFADAASWIKVFDCKQEKIISESFVTDGTPIKTPYGVFVNPLNSDVYITDAQQFTIWGDVLCFDKTGKLKFKIQEIGLNPNKIVFKPK